MGSPGFAVPSLNALVEAGHEVIGAYCQPPRPAGRGKADRKTAVHERAEALGIPVRTPKTLRNEEEQAKFTALDADVAIVAAYGLILPKPILEAPRGGCINVHASLLPRWRGAAPIQRAILAGDEVTGVTIMQMEEGLDTGPMLLSVPTTIDLKNGGELTDELAKLGAVALARWLDTPTAPKAQPEVGVTYAKKIDKAEARIDWAVGAEQIWRQIRAFNPSPGAWFETKGERIKILAGQLEPPSGTPGRVLDDELLVGCGAYSLRPIRVQRAGKGIMSGKELLRGFPIPEGTQLS